MGGPLHWAARFGRKKIVAALIASSASAGAVTDPSPRDPTGKSAISIASTSGHKELAGYLSEVVVTSHLCHPLCWKKVSFQNGLLRWK